jgi:threonine synthase
MGAPIERIALSVNENKTIPDYLFSGNYEKRPSVATLANAMDVGAPSNMERLFDLYPDIDTMRKMVSAWSVDDETIKKTIKEVYDESGYIMCPHTATGERVRRDQFSGKPTIVVSTAHPAKFEQVVEPLINTEIPIPENLKQLLDKETSFKQVGKEYRELFE